MTERQDRDRDATYVPPIPENVKPKGSPDNAVEMAAGGEYERKAMDEQREKMEDPGRTDNPRGTGVGYGGAGGALYGNEQEGAPAAGRGRVSGEREDSMQHQEERQHEQQSTPNKPNGGAGAQQSTGGMPPRQGTGSTPQSHTAATPTRTEATGNTTQVTRSNPPAAGHTGAQPSPSPKDQALDKAADAKDAALSKAADVKDDALNKVAGAKDDALSKATDLKEGTQGKIVDIRDQAQAKMDDVKGQTQDTLEGVKANLQTRTDQLKETMSGKTDQLLGTVTEKSGQMKQAANDKSTQAGGKLTDLAGTLREKTQTLEPDHPVANVATKAADALEQTGTYLQASTPEDWVGDLKRLIAHKPIESVLLAAGLGYMAARAFRK